MPHDDDAKCKDFGQQDGMHHVMSRMLGHNSHPWTWSICSRHFLTEYLELVESVYRSKKITIYYNDKIILFLKGWKWKMSTRRR